MWQAIANSNPPPNAKPLIAAITGLLQFSILLKTKCPLFDSSLAFSELKAENSLISAPATKDFSPLPVTMTQFTFLSEFKMSKTFSKSLKTCAFKAFRLSGLLMVTTAIFLSIVNFILS